MNKYVIPILLAMAIITCISVRGCINGNKKAGDISYAADHRDDTIKYWRDQYNTEHAQKISAQGTSAEMTAVYKNDMDSAAKLDDIKTKQIEGLQKAVANIHGSYTVRVDTVHHHDTTILDYSYTDAYFHEDGEISGDSVHVSHTEQVPIHLTQYWKRKWFLGKKTHYVDGYSDNPNVHLTGLQSIRIDGKEPGRFSAGPYVGIDITGHVSAGIAVSYSLFRW